MALLQATSMLQSRTLSLNASSRGAPHQMPRCVHLQAAAAGRTSIVKAASASHSEDVASVHGSQQYPITLKHTTQHSSEGARASSLQQHQQHINTSIVAASSRPGPSRRGLLMGAGMLTAAALTSTAPTQALAAADTLPKAYREVVRKVATSLKESIEAERSGAKETEVRRKADPAKEALQTFVRKWRDDRRVIGHPSHKEVLAILAELGAFYQTAGPRARLTAEVQDRLLVHIQAAEDALEGKSSTSSGGSSGSTAGSGSLLGSGEEDSLRELLPGSV